MTHGAVASLDLGEELVEQILQDYRTAPISEKMRATLGFLEKLTLHPESMDAPDLSPLIDAGVSRAAAEEAVFVCFLFSIINRLADAFDFDIPPDRALKGISRVMKAVDYRLG
ncbi:MAG: hypothetical protein DWQ07_10100 [Chloroflexi bacterium]|nr:MAG: hypothetical protein DWQ07_10100 [Chloroflexota bacterium]MBL1192937.1 hypothetical protein [Chloroflexota bacterium]NOH10229.1 hypothetical protein [Chloroflexota bacterium]